MKTFKYTSIYELSDKLPFIPKLAKQLESQFFLDYSVYMQSYRKEVFNHHYWIDDLETITDNKADILEENPEYEKTLNQIDKLIIFMIENEIEFVTI